MDFEERALVISYLEEKEIFDDEGNLQDIQRQPHRRRCVLLSREPSDPLSTTH